jgi:hypothetical protein
VPVPVVRPPLDWFAPTGVRLDAGSRVVVMPDTGGVAQALSTALADRGVTILAADMATDTHALAAQITTWLADGPIDGATPWPRSTRKGRLPTSTSTSTNATTDCGCASSSSPARRVAERGAFVVAVTRNGSAHGYDDARARSAMAGSDHGQVVGMLSMVDALAAPSALSLTMSDPGERFELVG